MMPPGVNRQRSRRHGHAGALAGRPRSDTVTALPTIALTQVLARVSEPLARVLVKEQVIAVSAALTVSTFAAGPERTVALPLQLGPEDV